MKNGESKPYLMFIVFFKNRVSFFYSEHQIRLSEAKKHFVGVK